ITLGVETDSLDADGEVTATHSMTPPDGAVMERAAAKLSGDIMQVPPMVSAIKVDGKRLHQLAREGKEVDREPRPVRVGRFDVASTADPLVWNATIDCSSGTYVRVLAADLGKDLGGGAHLSRLRRTAVGPFVIDEAGTMESASVLDMGAVARVMETAVVTDEVAALVANGRVLPMGEVGPTQEADGPWAVLGPESTLLAVYERHGADTAKPVMVVPT
ncbi:MAG: tRNA pseudouridine(55) synthase TruB, partial [Microthrixaceae bacterium]